MDNEKQGSNKDMSVTHKTSIFAESKKRAQAALKRKDRTGLLQGLKDELRKVSWTSKEELKLCTKIVVGSTLLFGLGIYVVDLVVKGFLDGIHVLTRLVFGA
jgi:preprotein translocase subunit SecE